MADFNIRCPKSYPNVCGLPQPEREHLLQKAKYRIFFMLQFKRKDAYVIKIVEDFFKQPYHLIKADVQPGNSVKICKICKCALACDCGIAILTPRNPNVYTEIGMLIALGKPMLIFVNTNEMKPEKIPFDLNSRMVIPYNDEASFEEGLKREIKLFEELLQLRSQFEMDWEERVKKEVINLSSQQARLVQELLFTKNVLEEVYIRVMFGLKKDEINKLKNKGFLCYNKQSSLASGTETEVRISYYINPEFVSILQRNYELLKKQIEVDKE